MSNWTHVAAIVRIDYVSFFDGEAPDFEKVFGKELPWEAPLELWNEADEHPERFLPLGSEGSLTMTVWENPDKCCVDHFTVAIFGDLRDHDDPQGIVDWFKGKVEEFGYSARNATIVATNECNGSATWSDGIGHERRQN